MMTFFSILLVTSTVVFDKDVQGKKTEVSWLIEQKEKMIEILGKAENKKTEIVCDLNYHFHQYSAQQAGQDNIFTVKRDQNNLVVEVTGTGNVKSETYDIGKKNWVQDFSFGLRPFFISDDDSIKFEIINPKDLIIRTMVATKCEIEYKTFNSVEYRAQKVKVTLDGFYKKFWKAELWYDTKSHNLLYYKANEGPSTPYTILTIKELKK